MLQDLTILNGEMPLKFIPTNTIYTINLTTDDDILKFDYKIAKNANISIINEKLQEGVNEVVLTVYNDLDMMSYYLYVNKDNSSFTVNSVNKEILLDIKRTDTVPNYAAPSIGAVSFLIILLFFTLLFKKKKKY